MTQDDGSMPLMPKGSITNAPRVSKSTKALPPEERAAARKAGKAGGTKSAAKSGAAQSTARAAAKSGAKPGAAKSGTATTKSAAVKPSAKSGAAKTTAKSAAKSGAKSSAKSGAAKSGAAKSSAAAVKSGAVKSTPAKSAKATSKSAATKAAAKSSAKPAAKPTAKTAAKATGKAAAKRNAAQTPAKTREPRTHLGRWWHRLQSSPDRVTLAMSIVALGVVYGDIGTSPLYTFQTFISGQGGIVHADRPAVLGMLSLVFWSITLITTVKYVFIAMRIDNRGEGGIFALYSLVRRYGKWLAIPAMVGGAAFLADSVLTPAVSISSAVEGLKTLPPLQPVFEANQNLTLMITVVIILILFAIQSRGTERIGKVFGLVVMVWFGFLAVVGAFNLSNDWTVLEALNPMYGIEFLLSPHNAAGLTVMGTVFLSTTGAEALYSDMGHVGRGNIYFTWPFIKVALVFNYFGQGAWILANNDNRDIIKIDNLNPFFQMMDPDVRYVAVALSVAAGVIASQALITGAFTMVSEATSLNWMPHLQIRYPARTRGQLYIPAINLVLCASTLLVLALFKDSEHIAAAYGLALTITMITTTVLLAAYIWAGWRKRVGAIVFTVIFLAIQIMFFLASMAKFLHGGWFTMLLTLAILFIMYTWDQGTKVERSQRRHMSPDEFLPALDKLHGDFRFPYFADNVVYLTSDAEMRRLDTDIFFSIFADHPKRARAWWAVSVQTTDDPYTREYSVENFGTEYLFRVRMRLGFKVDQNVATYLHQIMHELIDAHELPQQKTIYPKLDEDPEIGTIRYVLIHKALMPESKITSRGAFSLKFKYAIRHVAGSPAQWFGLAPYNPAVEVLPLFVSTVDVPPLKRTSLRKPKRPITLKEIFEEQQLDAQSEAQSAERKAMEAAAQAAAAAAKAAAAAAAAAKLPKPTVAKASSKTSRAAASKAAASKVAAAKAKPQAQAQAVASSVADARASVTDAPASSAALPSETASPVASSVSAVASPAAVPSVTASPAAVSAPVDDAPTIDASAPAKPSRSARKPRGAADSPAPMPAPVNADAEAVASSVSAAEEALADVTGDADDADVVKAANAVAEAAANALSAAVAKDADDAGDAVDEDSVGVIDAPDVDSDDAIDAGDAAGVADPAGVADAADATDEETTTVMAPIAAPRPVKSAPMPAVPASADSPSRTVPTAAAAPASSPAPASDMSPTA